MIDVSGTYRLASSLSLRPTPEGFLVESPLSGKAFRLASPSVFRVMLALTRPARVGELLERVETEAEREWMREFLGRCRENGMLVRVGDDGVAEEDADGRAHWEFHDLLFHYRSRGGRNPWPLGATYHLADVLPPEPAFKNGSAPEAIPLPRPDLDRLAAEDLTLTRALEERRTRYDGGPLSLEALGAFLFRTFRVARSTGGDDPLVGKVYPSAGGLHPLELYVVPGQCPELPDGVWHYRPAEHALVRAAAAGPEVDALLEEARGRTGGHLPGAPPVLLVFTARFRRVMAKYQSIGYRLILQEVGGVFQTMYLVATAMRLAPCALGAGDPDRFSRLIGTDYYRETSVGEFVLGGLGE